MGPVYQFEIELLLQFLKEYSLIAMGSYVVLCHSTNSIMYLNITYM